MCINNNLFYAEAVIVTDERYGHKSNFSLVNNFNCPSVSNIRNLSSCSLIASSSSCGYRCSGGNSVGISCFGKTVYR